MMISPHFSDWEFTLSNTAVRRGIVNEPSQPTWENLKALALTVLEPARKACGPLHITSGYRCFPLNVAVGGAKDSQHVKGEAADVIPYQGSIVDLFRWLYFSETPWDQLIAEFGPSWVHVSHVREGAQRRQALVASKLNGKTVYAQLTAEQVERL